MPEIYLHGFGMKRKGGLRRKVEGLSPVPRIKVIRTVGEYKMMHLKAIVQDALLSE